MLLMICVCVGVGCDGYVIVEIGGMVYGYFYG